MAEVLATDERIERAVVDELSRSSGIDPERIRVNVAGAVVTLTGAVRDSAERSAAVRAVRRVRGVRAVNDRMRTAKRTLDAIDRAIESSIRDLIAHDLGNDVHVDATVQDRDVTLSGFVSSSAERLRLYSAVIEIPGARRIIERVRIAVPPVGVEDAALRAKILKQLENCAGVTATQIGVAVHAGTILLSGMVRTDAERVAARECAFRVPGVISIADEIKIETEGYATSDIALASEVAAVLLGDEKLRNLAIHSEVTEGVATLRGTVATAQQRDTLLTVISHLSGISGVEDRVTIANRERV